MKISEIIADKYKLRIPPTVYYDLLADVQEAEEEQEPKTGHWFYDKSIENWRCSECQETPKTMGYCGSANFMAEHFKFCNHCGAKMVDQGSEGKE